MQTTFRPTLVRQEVDLHGAAARDSTLLWQLVLEAVAVAGVTVVATAKHDFPGGGFTGVVVIAESHVAVHSWPEHAYAYAEILTCGKAEAATLFVEALTEKVEAA